jgi:hypothetical protein
MDVGFFHKLYFFHLTPLSGPPTLLPVDANCGGILLAPIPTPLIQDCATTLIFELGENHDHLGQAHAQLQLQH